MNISENEAHSAIYCSENEYFARRCRHYKAKVWIAEPASFSTVFREHLKDRAIARWLYRKLRSLNISR